MDKSGVTMISATKETYQLLASLVTRLTLDQVIRLITDAILQFELPNGRQCLEQSKI